MRRCGTEPSQREDPQPPPGERARPRRGLRGRERDRRGARDQRAARSARPLGASTLGKRLQPASSSSSTRTRTRPRGSTGWILRSRRPGRPVFRSSRSSTRVARTTSFAAGVASAPGRAERVEDRRRTSWRALPRISTGWGAPRRARDLLAGCGRKLTGDELGRSAPWPRSRRARAAVARRTSVSPASSPGTPSACRPWRSSAIRVRACRSSRIPGPSRRLRRSRPRSPEPPPEPQPEPDPDRI